MSTELMTLNNYGDINIADLLGKIKEKYGENVDFSKVNMTITYKQYKCFGYDLYDHDDYHISISTEECKES